MSDAAARPRTALVGLAVAASLFALLIPVLVTPLPPVTDYPNHLARLWLVAGGIAQAPFPAIYALDWSTTWSNIGIDAVAAAVGQTVPDGALGPALLAASLLLPPLGAVLLNRALFGGWHWWQAAFAVLAWNATFAAGLLNFQIGLGLALTAAAADPVLARRALTFAVMARLLAASLLCVVHVLPACFYAALLGALALGPGVTPLAALSLRNGLPQAVLRRALPAILPIVAIMLLAPTTPGLGTPNDADSMWEGFSLFGKALALTSAFATYQPILDLAFLGMTWAVLRLTAPGHAVALHHGLAWLAAALIIATLLVPPSVGGPLLLDRRLPVMALLTFAAALHPKARSPDAARLALFALLLLGLLRTGFVTGVWLARQEDARSLDRALALIPEGAAVLPVQPVVSAAGSLPIGRQVLDIGTQWHWPVVALPRRHAFVPTLFSAAGKQPVRVLPPWDAIAIGDGQPVLLPLLERMPDDALTQRWFGYARDWRTRFELLLVLNGDVDPDALAPLRRIGVEPLIDSGFAQLYRIPRPPGP